MEEARRHARVAPILRRVLGLGLRVLPGDAPGVIYTTLLRPAPLRAAAHRILRGLIPAEIALPEGRLRLNPDDPVVSGALALGLYERQVSARFRAEVRPGMTVVDVGANLGYYAVIALGRNAPAGRVVAFEPDPANHALLLRNLLPFGDRATARRQAVTAAPGTLTLHRHPDNKGKHSVFAAPGLDAGVSVEAVTLDTALAELGRPRVDVIKLDVEGAEPLALVGMADTLARHRPVLFLECAPKRWARAGFDPVAVLGGLKAQGYALTLIDEGGGADAPVEPAALPGRLRGRDPYVNLIARHR